MLISLNRLPNDIQHGPAWNNYSQSSYMFVDGHIEVYNLKHDVVEPLRFSRDGARNGIPVAMAVGGFLFHSTTEVSWRDYVHIGMEMAAKDPRRCFIKVNVYHMCHIPTLAHCKPLSSCKTIYNHVTTRPAARDDRARG